MWVTVIYLLFFAIAFYAATAGFNIKQLHG